MSDMEEESEDFCAYCGQEGLLSICDVSGCGKVYHSECLGYYPGETFVCPRHGCALCRRADDEVDAAAGADLFRCGSCPTSYCPAHKPDDAPYKKALSLSSVEPLPDNTFTAVWVPGPELRAPPPPDGGRVGGDAAPPPALPAQAAPAEEPASVKPLAAAAPEPTLVAAVGVGGEDAAAEDGEGREAGGEAVGGRPAKRARVQFALGGTSTGSDDAAGVAYSTPAPDVQEDGESIASGRGGSRRGGKPPAGGARRVGTRSQNAELAGAARDAATASPAFPGDVSDGDSVGARRAFGPRGGKRKRGSDVSLPPLHVEDRDKEEEREKEVVAAPPPPPPPEKPSVGGSESDKESEVDGEAPSVRALTTPTPAPPTAGTPHGVSAPTDAAARALLGAAAASTPAGSDGGGGRGGGGKGGGPLVGAPPAAPPLASQTPVTSGATLALSSARGNKRGGDPILAERHREKTGSSVKASNCVSCSAPSVRLAFARALETAWVDTVIRLLAKREGKEEPGVSVPVVVDAGLTGMGVDMGNLPLSDLGPNALVLALLAPVTDGDAAPLYLSLGHGRAALGVGTHVVAQGSAGSSTGEAPSGTPTSTRQALVRAVGDAEPSIIASVLCTPHEYAAVPSRPACFGDVLARIRACAYTKLQDVVNDVKFVTHVAGVLAGSLPPETLSRREAEPSASSIVGAPASSGGGLQSPNPVWATDANGELSDEAMRSGYACDIPLPTMDMQVESSGGDGGPPSAPPIRALGPLNGGEADKLASTVNAGLADNPRHLFYQASVTVGDVFTRRFTRDRRQGKVLRELETRLASEVSGCPPLPTNLPTIKVPAPGFIDSLYAVPSASSGAGEGSSSSSAAAPWLPRLLAELGLTDEEALARLYAARLSCSRPELSWTARPYAWNRASLQTWLTVLQSSIPSGGSKHPAEAAKRALTDDKNRRKPIMHAPGKDPIRFSTSTLDDLLDSAPDAVARHARRPGEGRSAEDASLLDDVGIDAAGRRTRALLSAFHENLHDALEPLRQYQSGMQRNVEPHSLLQGAAAQRGEDDAMDVDGAPHGGAGQPDAIAYDQAVAEYAAVELARAVRREHKRRNEGSGGGGGGGGALAPSHHPPLVSDTDLDLLERTVGWAKDKYLHVTRLPEALASPRRTPHRREQQAQGGSGEGRSLFGAGLAGAAISGSNRRFSGASAARTGTERPAWQPVFSSFAGPGQASVQDALAKLASLSSASSALQLPAPAGPVVVIGSATSGLASSSSSSDVHMHGVGEGGAAETVARQAVARASATEAAMTSLADSTSRSLLSLQGQIGTMASALGTLVSGQLNAQAALATSLQGLACSVDRLQALVTDQAARGPTGRRHIPSLPFPVPHSGQEPPPASLRATYASFTGQEKQAGLMLSELAALDLDMEAGAGGTPGLVDLLPPSSEEVGGLFDTLSASLRAGLVATGELRSAWAASRRALLSVPARVDVERRLVVRAGMDSDDVAMEWNTGAGAESRLQPPPPDVVDDGVLGAQAYEEDDGGEEGIITLGEGRVAAEYALANANLRAHVNKLRLRLAASHASGGGGQTDGRGTRPH